MHRIRRALLSVWDKTGLLPLARSLAAHGVELFSTGGTRAALLADGLEVRDVQTLTGRPEAFGGRMKTLSYEIASGILFDRARDAAEAEALAIEPIDLVVVNLYPFEHHRDRGLPLDELIEYVDIGGPTMLRAAAKNFRSVTVVTDPDDYAVLVAELDANGGCTTLPTRRRLMQVAYEKTAAYDMAIAEHLAAEAGAPTRALRFGVASPLRYGENPHQPAAVFRGRSGPSPMERVIGGKALSYNNLLDVEAALAAIEGQGPGFAVAVIKHGNPCGLAVAPTAAEALQLAWAGDPVSAFGSVIAFSGPLTAADLAPLSLDDRANRRFVEVLVAPAFDDSARALAAHHKPLRLVELAAADLMALPDRRIVLGQLLEQERDRTLAEGYRVAAGEPGAGLDAALAEFGLRAARSVKSNAVVIVRRLDAQRLQLLGMGAGQPNRVASAQLAVKQAEATLRAAAPIEGTEVAMREAYAVSDAFLPFRDTLDVLADAGVGALIQPGGSIRDAEVIEAAVERGVRLILSHVRHFRH